MAVVACGFDEEQGFEHGHAGVVVAPGQLRVVPVHAVLWWCSPDMLGRLPGLTRSVCPAKTTRSS